MGCDGHTRLAQQTPHPPQLNTPSCRDPTSSPHLWVWVTVLAEVGRVEEKRCICPAVCQNAAREKKEEKKRRKGAAAWPHRRTGDDVVWPHKKRKHKALFFRRASVAFGLLLVVRLSENKERADCCHPPPPPLAVTFVCANASRSCSRAGVFAHRGPQAECLPCRW